MYENNGYTFFPDLREQEDIKTIPTKDIVELLSSEPLLAGRFVHELQRQGRLPDLYQALSSCNQLPTIRSAVMSDLIAPTAMMCSVGKVSEGREFVRSVYDLFARLEINAPLDVELPDLAIRVIADHTHNCMQRVDKLITRYKAVLNA